MVTRIKRGYCPDGLARERKLTFVAILVYRCTDLPIYRCSDVPIYRFTDVSMCRCIENGTFYEGKWYVLRQDAHENKPRILHQMASRAKRKLTFVPILVYRCTDLPMYRCSDVPIYRFTDLPMYRCVDVWKMVRFIEENGTF